MCSTPRFAEQTAAMREAFTEAFADHPADPLSAFDSTFRTLAVDPFDLFLVERVDGSPDAGEYRLAIRQWNEYMAKAGRHPACPNVAHVHGFARWLRTETPRRTLRLLGRAYRFWQHEPTLPHPPEYDPFERAAETTKTNTEATVAGSDSAQSGRCRR